MRAPANHPAFESTECADPICPLVSIVVPSYNHGRYLTACLASITQQTYNNIELIVIDDGSTDDSPKIIANLAEKYHFKYFLRSNHGLAATLNFALEHVTGKYYAMLSSDDLLAPQKTSVLVDFMEQNPTVGGIGSGHIVIDEYGATTGKTKTFPFSVASFDELYADIKPMPSAPTMLLRTDLVKKVGSYDTNIRLEDAAMWLKIAACGHTIVTLPDTLAYYRIHHNNSYKNTEMMYHSLLQIYGQYSQHPLWPTQKYKIMHAYFYKGVKRHHLLARQIFHDLAWSHITIRMVLSMVKINVKDGARTILKYLGAHKEVQ